MDNLIDLKFVLKKSCCLPPLENDELEAMPLKTGAEWSWSWECPSPKGRSALETTEKTSNDTTCNINVYILIQMLYPAPASCFLFSKLNGEVIGVKTFIVKLSKQ